MQPYSRCPLVTSVELAVCVLEDHPLMDAGHGSVLNAAGEVEMDAIITDGCKTVRIHLVYIIIESTVTSQHHSTLGL